MELKFGIQLRISRMEFKEGKIHHRHKRRPDGRGLRYNKVRKVSRVYTYINTNRPGKLSAKGQSRCGSVGVRSPERGTRRGVYSGS